MSELKEFLEGSSTRMSDSAKLELAERYVEKSLPEICEDLGITFRKSFHAKIDNALNKKNPNKNQSAKGSGVKLGTKKCACNKAITGEYEIINQKRVCVGCVFKTLA